MQGIRKITNSLALCLIVGTLSMSPASAHGVLISMTPAADSVATSAPSEVVLTFDEKISPNGNGLTVTAPDGIRVDIGTPKVVDAKLSVKLGPISLNGHYLVNYRVVSADGHPVEGSAGFAIKIAGLTASSTPKIDVSGEGESGIEKGEGRPVGESDFANIYYFLLAAFIGGLYIYSLRRYRRRNKTST